MADAKVIPFDDDRSRGGAVQRPPRRRAAGSRRKGDPAVVREVQPLPGRAFPQDDV
ncbi:glycerol acyltransferase, partial [Streptomyces sp. NPDC127044]